MKKILLFFFSISTSALIGYGQCDKNVTYTASSAAVSHGEGNAKDTIREKIVVQTNKTTVKLTHSDREDDALKGSIKDISCQWKEAFKNGQSILKCSLTEPNGNVSDGTLSIGARDGKIVITLEMQDPGGESKKFEIFVTGYTIEQ